MRKRRAVVFVSLLASTIGCDHATKIAATSWLEPSSVLSLAAGAVRLELARNPGAFMSLGAELPAQLRLPLFLSLMPLAALAASVLVVRSGASRTRSLVAGALIAGGGLSNWLDRVFNEGHVIDFVSIGVGWLRTGIFNVADLALLVGLLLVVVRRPRHPQPAA
jgi:signal peptidase II